MIALSVIIFVLGYLAIALEHPLRINKAAPALLTGVICWLLYFLHAHSAAEANEVLLHHLGDIASILFFLLGAMTIVELIDSYNGFDIMTSKISTTGKSKLLITITIITFFLSALLDNLTTAIVMSSLCQKLLSDKKDRWWFAGMVVIAANAGGAWSPLGDVTTTMLWIGGQVTAMNIIVKTILPSISVCLLPLLILSYRYRGAAFATSAATGSTPSAESNVILFSGMAFLISVPVFKTLTHMPPFMGMLLALGGMWIITSFMKLRSKTSGQERYTVADALQRIDTPSILFFLGILLAVASLDAFGVLREMAATMSSVLKNDYLIGIALGALSALVDNVPLVAAAQGMYDLNQYPTDHYFWEFLALTTGTGGSMIIIGSAAGVAIMGIEEIDFVWYFKKISFLAFSGFAAGVFMFMIQQMIF